MDPKSIESSDALTWLLVYTKARAETWADINLRNQGFATLLPRVASRGGNAPLFPRYMFVGHEPSAATTALRNSLGVLYVVTCGGNAARISADVIAEIRARMDRHGIVAVDSRGKEDSLFSSRERDRVRALVKLADAGFKIRIA